MNLQEELKALKERIAELEEQEERERVFPRFMDVYYYIQASGRVDNTYWSEEVTDFQKKWLGNVFRTKEQAECAVEKMKVEAELRKFSKPFEYGKFNYSLIFDIDGDNFRTDFTGYCPPQGAIYFESEEKAQQAVSTVGVERVKKYIFGVEE